MDRDRIFRHYYVYQTTCLIDNKVYVGVHATDSLDDGYLGSGKYFLNAVRKHGRENFIKRILFEGSNYQDILDKEEEIVTEEFIQQDCVYNLRKGGEGGCRLRADLEELRKQNAAQAHRDVVLGTHRSEDTKKRISEKLKGRRVGAALRDSKYPTEKRKCIVCGTEFTVRLTPRRRGLYCSRQCAGSSSKNKKYVVESGIKKRS